MWRICHKNGVKCLGGGWRRIFTTLMEREKNAFFQLNGAEITFAFGAEELINICQMCQK